MSVCRSLGLAFGVLLFSALGAHAQTAAPSPNAPRTHVRLFEPYNGRELNSDLTVTGRVTGSCDAASMIDVNRSDAWACTVAYKVYDPCFANSDESELACPDLPTIGSGAMTDDAPLSVVLVRPADALDDTLANIPGPDATPFLLKLTDGQYCIPEPANVVYASLPVYGWCSESYWFGPGDLSQPLWTVPILQGGGTASISVVSNVGIDLLWY